MSLAEQIIFEPEANAIQTIERGTDLNAFDEYGFRPLIQAIICQKPRVFEALLEHGSDLEQQDILGRTPLQWAVEREAFEYAQVLLEAGANPNHHSIDGQPILVNPILREDLALTDLLLEYDANYTFAQDFISAKLLGHRYELSGETDIVNPKKVFIPLSFEGFYLEFTCGLISRSLNNFVHSMPGQKFKNMQAKFSKIQRALKQASQLMVYSKHKDKTPFNDTINAILNTDLLVLPVAHRGHAITLIQYGNLFAKCDRGVNRLTDTVILYHIGDPYTFTPELCKTLLYERKPASFIEVELKEILSLTPFNTLPTKSQLAGNCSWANVEACVPAMLFMLNMPEGGPRRKTGQLKRKMMHFYNTWVEWDKDSALEETLEDFQQADPVRQISKAMMLSMVLAQRCHHTVKQEVARAKKILKILTQPAFHFILKNFKKVYRKKHAQKVGKSRLKLLTACGVDPETLLFKNEARQKTILSTKTPDQMIKMTTALHIACLQGHFPSVQYLVEKLQINVNYQDRTGSTALMYASWKGHFKIVKYLIEKHHADLNLANYKGGTALRYARYADHKQIANYLKRLISS